MFFCPNLFLGILLMTAGILFIALNIASLVKSKEREKSLKWCLLSENIFIFGMGVLFILKYLNKTNDLLKTFNIVISKFKIAKRSEVSFSDECTFVDLFIEYSPIILPFVNSIVNYLGMSTNCWKEVCDGEFMENMSNINVDAVSCLKGSQAGTPKQSTSREMDKDRNETTINFNKKEDLISNHKNGATMMVKMTKNQVMLLSVFAQWLIPILASASMYSMQIKNLTKQDINLTFHDNCMKNKLVFKTKCYTYEFNMNGNIGNQSEGIQAATRAFLSSTMENEELLNIIKHPPNITHINNNSSYEVINIVDNIYKIANDFKNLDPNYLSIDDETDFFNIEPKEFNLSSSVAEWMEKHKISAGENYQQENCLKMCFIGSNDFKVYLLFLLILAYFLPILVTSILFTKTTDKICKNVVANNDNFMVGRAKKSFLWSIFTGSPMFFDFLLSVYLCNYSISSAMSTVFLISANLFHVIKAAMNLNYMKKRANNNSVDPII